LFLVGLLLRESDERPPQLLYFLCLLHCDAFLDHFSRMHFSSCLCVSNSVSPPLTIDIGSSRRYPNLAHSVAKHAEEKKVDISGATLTLMVPHLLKRMDIESVIKQSVTRHMQQEGYVPAETLRVLMSACIKQRQLELAFSLVDSFIDAKRARNQRLDASECRDLLFIFVALGHTEHAENLLAELYRRGTLGSLFFSRFFPLNPLLTNDSPFLFIDERAVSTIVHALSVRGIKSELRNLTKQEWWNHASASASVYSRFFMACCKVGDFETAISEFERLASSMPSGGPHLYLTFFSAP
jgi:hypothetical protein